MNIGVVLSGCDLGGLAAAHLLYELERLGLTIRMVSASGTPAAGAMLYKCGVPEETCRKRVAQFLSDTRNVDIDMAIAEFSAALPSKSEREVPLVISAVNLPDGMICAFTDVFAFSSSKLRTFDAGEDPYDRISASISPAGGLASYGYEGLSLCDFSVWYGIPVYPLKVVGIDKIVSATFLPDRPSTPFEALITHRIAGSAGLADLHIRISGADTPADEDGYIQAAVQGIQVHREEILKKSAF